MENGEDSDLASIVQREEIQYEDRWPGRNVTAMAIFDLMQSLDFSPNQ